MYVCMMQKSIATHSFPWSASCWPFESGGHCGDRVCVNAWRCGECEGCGECECECEEGRGECKLRRTGGRDVATEECPREENAWSGAVVRDLS